MAEPEQRYEKLIKNPTFRRLLNRFDLGKKKVLDIGSGWGEYLSLFGQGSLGITGQEAEVSFCKEKGLSAVICNAEYLDLYVQEKFDAIWANNFLEHILSPHQFLIKSKKVLEKDGIVIIGVPVVPRIISLLKIRKFSGSLADAHINFFTKKTIELTLQYAGYSVIESRPFIFKNKILDYCTFFIAPHIYVVSKVNPTFSYSKKKVAEWSNFKEYKELLDYSDQNR